MAPPNYTALIRALHIIYQGRQATPIEQAAMAGQLAFAGAPDTLNGLAGAYASSPAIAAIVDGLASGSKILGTASDSTIMFVSTVYSSLFGRAPDFDGLLFWATALEQHQLSRNAAPLSLMAGAQVNTSSQSQADNAVLAAKFSVTDIVDQFSQDLAPALNWVPYKPSASASFLLAAMNPQIPIAEYVNFALMLMGVVPEPTVHSGPIVYPPAPIAPVIPSSKVSIDAPSVVEGKSGAVALTFHLTLDAAPTSDVFVYYATQPGTAGKGDFQSLAGRVVFAAGQTSAEVNIQVMGDPLAEQNESMSLIVGGPNIVGAAATGTIINDDGPVTMIAPITLDGHHAPLLY